METVVLALRVALSLGVVLALLWVLQKRVARGRGGLLGTRRESTVTVVARQGVGAKASVVVVDVEGERLVLGVTDGGISVLAAAPTAPAPTTTAATVPAAPVGAPGDQAVDPFAAVLAAQPSALRPAGAAPSAPTVAPVQALPLRPRGAERRTAGRGVDRTAAASAVSASAVSASPAAASPASVQLDRALRARGRGASALDGSILSPDTWRQAAAVLRSRRAG